MFDGAVALVCTAMFDSLTDPRAVNELFPGELKFKCSMKHDELYTEC